MRVILITIITISSLIQAQSFNEQVDKNIIRGNLYTALLDITDQYKREKAPKNVREKLRNIIKRIGPHFFNTFSDIELRNVSIPTSNLIMAKRNLYLGKYKYALKRLKKLEKHNGFAAQAYLVKGNVYYKTKQYQKAIKAFKSCTKISAAAEDGLKQFHKETVLNSCRINLARTYFKMDKFDMSINAYNQVPKKSAKWPYTLLEKSWAYYHLGQYNRVLGILLTFNSPLLSSYFFPEAQALKAMSYFKMCYFDESEHIINVFYTKYKPKSQELKKLLANNNRHYFFDLIFENRDLVKNKSVFLNSLLTQVEKRSKHKLDMNSFFSFSSELYKASKYSRIKDIKKMQEEIKDQINHSVRLSMYNFINQIHSTSKHMFNLQLEILSKKRINLYKKKNQILGNEDGDKKNILIGKDDVFWDFKKSFWADELGDYTLALQNNCSIKRR